MPHATCIEPGHAYWQAGLLHAIDSAPSCLAQRQATGTGAELTVPAIWSRACGGAPGSAPVRGSVMASRCAAMLLGEGGCRRAVVSSSDMMPWKRASTLREARTSCARGP